MSNARNLARVVADTSGAIAATNLANAVPADGSITTAKLAANAVTDAKIAAVAASKLSGKVPSANANSGSVLQVVQSTKTDTQTFSGMYTAWADISGLSVTITPSSASSRIVILGHIAVGASGNPPQLRILRNSSLIFASDPAGSRKQAFVQPWGGGSNVEMFPTSPVFVDSPGTTSAVTYKFQISIGGGATNHINRSDRDQDGSYEDARGASSILVMEISG